MVVPISEMSFGTWILLMALSMTTMINFEIVIMYSESIANSIYVSIQLRCQNHIVDIFLNLF